MVTWDSRIVKRDSTVLPPPLDVSVWGWVTDLEDRSLYLRAVLLASFIYGWVVESVNLIVSARCLFISTFTWSLGGESALSSGSRCLHSPGGGSKRVQSGPASSSR